MRGMINVTKSSGLVESKGDVDYAFAGLSRPGLWLARVCSQVGALVSVCCLPACLPACLLSSSWDTFLVSFRFTLKNEKCEKLKVLRRSPVSIFITISDAIILILQEDYDFCSY